MNKAIHLNPDSSSVYINRDAANRYFWRVKEAKKNFQTAIEVAKKQENQNLIITIEKILQEINDKE